MSRSELKQWTEILTPWIQTIGLMVAAIFALVEYQDRKDDLKIQRSTTYLAQASSQELIEARSKLAERQHELVGELREILLAKDSAQDQINAAYFAFVVEDLVMHGSEQSLYTPFQLTLGFLDEGVVCAKQGLCDEEVIRANLTEFGRGFVRSYTPYICYLRHVWNDPSIGKRAEEFYNPGAAGEACKAYKQSAERLLQAKGTDKATAAEQRPQPDGTPLSRSPAG
ncbi:MAG TPA: hypothetical protein VF179_12800 [Thermoanaerobaculia bacterium]|nr:hypothetical protein [Thermoanaerobaculia bacterium]